MEGRCHSVISIAINPTAHPSLSWNGRYLAVIVQRGNRRMVLIEDRLSSRAHPLRLPSGRNPVRLSLAPDARQLAVQTAERGRWRWRFWISAASWNPTTQGPAPEHSHGVHTVTRPDRIIVTLLAALFSQVAADQDYARKQQSAAPCNAARTVDAGQR